MNSNPLGIPQRERSGSSTFGKYEYQYHWALCRIIDEQRNTREYALFMELHEDVVLADSLNSDTAMFEFNQVKNIGSPKYNIANLTKRKDGKGSILGKLVSSAINKPFSKSISTVNLVASCGYNIDLIDNSLNLDVITVGDLSEKSVDDLKSSLKKELGSDVLPDNLRFIIPSLSITDQQDSVIGKISTLISDIFPGSHCNAEYIYRTLIDELHRKGAVSYDYSKWDDLLENKALTSTKVTKAISAHVSLQDIQAVLTEASKIAEELGLTYIQQKRMRKNIEGIHIQSIGFPTSIKLKVSESIRLAITSVASKKSIELIDIISGVESLLPDKTKAHIGSNEIVRDHIVYEIITGDV